MHRYRALAVAGESAQTKLHDIFCFLVWRYCNLSSTPFLENETEGYRGVWEWEMGRVCFRFLVRGFSFSRCHGYSKAGAGAKAEASDMLLVWHLRVIN